MKTLKITRPHRHDGWLEGVYDGHKFCAKVYDEPSRFGINGGRTSKLQVLQKGAKNWSFTKTLYNYDRGIDIDHVIGAELAAELEKLPKVFRGFNG